MRSPHLNEGWLRQKYTEEGLSTYDIGKLVHRDPKRIYEKLLDFGIPTRPRGLNLKGVDNYMQTAERNPFQGRMHTAETRAILSAKASVPKPYLRGRRNGMFGRCGSLNPRFVDGSSPERQRLYASAKWKTVLRALRVRDGYRCRRCEAEKRNARGLHAHHIKSWAGNESLRFDLTNIVSLCRTCHSWVHSRKNTAREFMNP